MREQRRTPAAGLTLLAILAVSCGRPPAPASPPVGRGAPAPLRVQQMVGPDGKGTFVGPGVPEDVVPVVAAAGGAVPAGVTVLPRDIFTTRDFYQDRDLWSDRRCAARRPLRARA